MSAYSEYFVAVGVTSSTSRENRDELILKVLQDQSFSLLAKGLYTLLVEESGRPYDPFLEPVQPAEEIFRASRELLEVGLIEWP